MRKSSVSAMSTPRRVRCDGANAMVPPSLQRRLSRQSISSVLSRRSSIQENKKETKPPNDRQILQKNLKVLSIYLSENGYVHLGAPYSLQRILNSPSIRDVSCLFQFLISKLGIDYLRDKKFEDEFPRIMKLLLYPYIISKRQLQAVGSMHNWPSIVHALSWLCNLNKASKANDDDPLDFLKDTDENMLKYLGFEVDMQAYNAYLMGEDDYTQIDKDMCDKLPQILGMDKVKELDEQMEFLSEKEEERDKLKEIYQTTQRQNMLLTADSNKLVSYVCELEDFASKIDVRVSNLTEEGVNLKNELDLVKIEVDDKANIIANQGITVQEVEALKVIADNLKSQMVECEDVLNKLQAEVVTSDATLQKEKDELFAVIEEYHSIARDCNLIPDTACNAQGYNYAIHLPKPEESESGTSNIDDITRRLKLILKQWKESSRELRAQEMKAMEDVQHLQDIYASKVEEVHYLEAKIKRQKEATDIVKQDCADELHKLREETAKIEEDIIKLNLRNKGAYDIEALQKTNIDLHSEVIQLEEKQRSREIEVNEFLLKFCEIVINHKNAVEDRIFRFQNFITNWCNEMEKDKVRIYDFKKMRDKLKIDEVKREVDEMIAKCAAMK